jgi:hypothetical protein
MIGIVGIFLVPSPWLIRIGVNEEEINETNKVKLISLLRVEARSSVEKPINRE